MDGSFFFEDESIFQQSGTKTRTWAPRGKGTVVKSEPVRRSAKVLGAVSLEEQPKWHFRFVETFNQFTFLAFLKQVVRNNPGRKILMVLDNVGYHHARSVKEWVAEHSDHLELHYLPAYSPEFNPIEQVWRVTKRSATHNRHFAELSRLCRRLFRRFNRFQGNPAALRRPLRHYLDLLRSS